MASQRSPSKKLKAVTALVDALAADARTPTYPSPQARNAALEQLKLHGRDPTDADPIFTPFGIETLARHACSSESRETARCALRVLANAMLLRPDSRRLFVALGWATEAVVEVMRGGGDGGAWDDEFLAARVVFLMTYVDALDVQALVEKHGLARVLVDNLRRHAAKLGSARGGAHDDDPMEEMALAETLKLAFNLAANRPAVAAALTLTVEPLVALLWRSEPTAKAPLAPPLSLLINALMDLDFTTPTAQAALFPPNDENKVALRLIHILDLAFTAYADDELEQNANPLVSVIHHLHAAAPPAPKARIRETLLPTEEDRETVLGKGHTLASRLLANSNNPMTPYLRQTASHLLFDMSDRDPDRFVKNIGYGLASGFLFQNGLSPSSSVRVQEVGEEEEEKDDGRDNAPATGPARLARPANPITGQFLDLEKPVDVPPMSDAEKEREAERLFVLFQRLRENGVIQVEDPMRTALEQGRFEELPDDADVD